MILEIEGGEVLPHVFVWHLYLLFFILSYKGLSEVILSFIKFPEGFVLLVKSSELISLLLRVLLCFSLTKLMANNKVVMHTIFGSIFIDMLIHGLIQEYFHLLLQKCIEFGFELLFLLLGGQTFVIDLFIIFFDGQSKNGFLKLLAER